MRKNAQQLEEALNKLAMFVTTTKLNSSMAEQIVLMTAEIQQLYKSQQQSLLATISNIYDGIGNLRLTIQYQQFDLEATQRERNEARLECERLREQLGDI